jgi:alpha-glucuronidase
MSPADEDGDELWLRFRQVDNAIRLAEYRRAIICAVVFGTSAIAEILRRELARALPEILDRDVPISITPDGDALIVGTIDELTTIGIIVPPTESRELGDEGFRIRTHRAPSGNRILIAGNSAPAALTGTFDFLRLLQTHPAIHALDILSRRRILAPWDDLDGSIERGYAGCTLRNWDELPKTIDPRCHDFVFIYHLRSPRRSNSTAWRRTIRAIRQS